MEQTAGNVVEIDPGGRQGLLLGFGELQHVAEGGNLDGALHAVGSNGSRDGGGDSEDVDSGGHIAVLEVPPHRNLDVPRLLFLPPRRGVGIGGGRQRRSGRGEMRHPKEKKTRRRRRRPWKGGEFGRKVSHDENGLWCGNEFFLFRVLPFPWKWF